MRMSWSGCRALAMRPEMRVQLDADEAHALRRAWLMKLPMPQPGSRTVALSGTPRRASASCMAAMTVGEV